MKKIKTVFVIERTTRQVVPSVNKTAEWVLAEEGKATIKFDGTSVMIRDGVMYKRRIRKLFPKFLRMLRRGKNVDLTLDKYKSVPKEWEPAQEKPDPFTGEFPGWLPIGDGPDDKFHREALSKGEFEDGTYELVGPKIQGNLYKLTSHELRKHGEEEVEVERSWEGIKKWLHENDHEGLVFHHPDGRMAKIRKKDFGLRWGIPSHRNR